VPADPRRLAEAVARLRPRRWLTGRGRLRGRLKWVVVLLFVLPLASIFLKLSGHPWGETLDGAISLVGAHGRDRERFGSVLLVPVAAILAVIARVTLGIRILGPFRAFLLAVAFQATGIPVGLFFLTIVIAVIVAVRRPLRKFRLPHYGRLSVVMSIVAATITVSLILGQHLHLHALRRVAYFPIVALCLTGDTFDVTRRREGIRSALWRGCMTALLAILITKIAAVHGVQQTLVRFPELMIAEVGLIVVIAEFFGYRLLSVYNPPPVKKRRKSKHSKKSTPRARVAPTAVVSASVEPPPVQSPSAMSPSAVAVTKQS
jgi:hypothetical protein